MSVKTDPVPPVPEHTPPLKEDDGTAKFGKYFNHAWTRWFISLREKINVISASLVNLGDVSGSGMLAKDGDSWFTRTISGIAGRTSISNGSGLLGNPTIDVVTADLIEGTNVSFTGSGSNRLIDNGLGNLTINASGGGGGSWSRIFVILSGSSSTGWGGYTVRNVVNSLLLVPGTTIRITFRGPSSATTTTIGAAYVQIVDILGQPYSFSTTPVQILFSGSPSTVLNQNQILAADNIALGLTGLVNLVISFQITGTSDLYAGAAEGINSYYILGADASTVAATGYTGFVSNNSRGVIKLEIS